MAHVTRNILSSIKTQLAVICSVLLISTLSLLVCVHTFQLVITPILNFEQA